MQPYGDESFDNLDKDFPVETENGRVENAGNKISDCIPIWIKSWYVTYIVSPSFLSSGGGNMCGFPLLEWAKGDLISPHPEITG